MEFFNFIKIAVIIYVVLSIIIAFIRLYRRYINHKANKELIKYLKSRKDEEDL